MSVLDALLCRRPIVRGRWGRNSLDGQRLRVTDISEVRDELEAIDHLGTSRATTVNAEAEDTTETVTQVLLRRFVVRVALKTGIRHPANVLALLQPLGKRQSVLAVAFSPQAQGLDTQEQLLRGEGVERCAEIALDFDTSTDDEGDGAEGVPEFEAVIALARLDELRETSAVLAPIELA